MKAAGMLVSLLLLQSTLVSAVNIIGPQKTIFDDLLNHLFSNESFPYNAAAMPICQRDQQLQVGQDMVLLQLFDLDEPTQMLTVDVWVESTWRDCRLSWNPSKFNGVDSFAIKSEEIWYPDLIFYESLHGNFEEGMFIYGESTARVYSDGSVQLGNQVVFKVFCRIDIADFPYDSQKCNITFSSWTKDFSNFRLRKKSEEKSEGNDHAFTSASNGEWLVEGFPSFEAVSVRQLGMDESSGKSRKYSEVIFQLQLKRKPLFYQAYMLFPCMLLTWLTLFVFLLPAASGEKIAYVTTILLSLVVFLLLVAENIPRSGDAVPILGKYFCMAVALVSIANVKTIISYSIALRSKNFCVPRWMQWILSHGWLLGVRTEHHNGTAKILAFKSRRQARSDASPVRDNEAVELHYSPNAEAAATAAKNSNGNDDEDDDGDCINDWRFLGMIFDRLFFIIYFIANVIVSVWILTRT